MKKMSRKELRILWISLVLLALFISPLFILGENAHIRVHDNLDSNIAWYRVLAKSGEIRGSVNATIPQVMNGLSRNAYGTEFSGIVWLHAWFPPMVAYGLSQLITRVFAFLGMYLLLSRHFIKDRNYYIVSIGVALLFALTPFWPSGMLSTLGMPLALWAFLNIRKREGTWKEWLTLTLLPLYASFVLGFFFFLSAVGILWLIDWVRFKRFNAPFLASVAWMTSLFLAIEYRLVYSMFIKQGPTSRDQFLSSTLSFDQCIRLTFKNFVFGHTHVITLHTFVILPLLLFVMGHILVHKNVRQEKAFVCLFILNLALSTWYAFWFFKGWQPLKHRFMLLNDFNFARYHFLRPMVIYVQFALGLVYLARRFPERRGRQCMQICLVLQLVVLSMANDELIYRDKGAPSFKQFYAVQQFADIKHYIGRDPAAYRVVSIGIHPAIAQYNGFYTLDSYNNFYLLTYKERFRNIIKGELNKSPKLKYYFDHWGGRCYVFDSELGKKYAYTKHSKKHIRQLAFNTAVFYQMGGRYVLSAVPIDNAGQEHLRLLRAFNNRESAWKIYLYQAERAGKVK